MREILRGANTVALVAITALASLGVEANAQDTFINQNISGFNLPGVQLPQGHDEVRAADGTTCRSAVSGSGAYMDMGIIGNPEQDQTEGSLSAYGRVVIPLGRKAKRLDCNRLYDLEVARLEMELKLMQMGLTRGIAPVSESSSSHGSESASSDDQDIVASQQTTENQQVAKVEEKTNSWADDGWSTEGLKK